MGIEQKTINFSRADTKPVGFKKCCNYCEKELIAMKSHKYRTTEREMNSTTIKEGSSID